MNDRLRRAMALRAQGFDRPGLAVSRRQLLQAAGIAAAAAPFGTRAFAQAANPLRLVLWPMMNGAEPNYFYPTPGNPALSMITEPIKAYARYASFIKGVNVAGSVNHFAVRSIYSGFPVANYESPDPNVKSVDQLVADHIAATAPTPLKSLHLGVIPADSINYYQRAGRSTFFFAPKPVDYEANPVTAFDRVFAGAAPAPGPVAGSADFTNDSLDLLEAEMAELGGKITGVPSETNKLALHREALRGLRPKIVAPGGMTPAAGDGKTLASVEKLRPALMGNAKDAYKHQYFSDVFDAQVDIMARALTSGLTRVATLQAGSADGNATVPVGRGFPHHNTSHGNQASFSMCQNWYFTKMNRLLQALDVPDPLAPGKTVLDNTMLVLIAECLPVGHGSNGVPTLIVGGGAGKLKPGTFVQGSGITNKNVCATVLRAFGLPTAHFGDKVVSEVLL
jgi:hypothetical protein